MHGKKGYTIETPRPEKSVENLPRQDVQSSVHEEEGSVLKTSFFLDLLERGNEEKLLRYIERKNYDLEPTYDRAGKYKTIEIRDRYGKVVLFIDFDWYRKEMEEEGAEAGYKEEQRMARKNERILSEVVRQQGTKTVEVKPETDPKKIN